MIAEQAFVSPFKDTRWGSKFLIGSLLTFAGYFIPIVPMLFVWGYVVRMMRHTIDTGELALPEWDDWGDLGLKGIHYLFVYLVYLLPGLILLACAIATFLAGSFVGNAREVVTLQSGVTPWLGVFNTFALLSSIAMCILGTLALLGGVLAAPLAVARFATTNDLASAFHLDRIWQLIRTQLGQWVLTWAMAMGIRYALLLFLGLLYYTVCLCFLVPIVAAPISFYRRIFMMTLFAQIYRQGELESGRQGPVAPEPAPPSSPAPHSEGATPPLDTSAGEGKATPLTTTEAPAPSSLYELSISELGLPGRIEAALMEAKYITIGHVVDALRESESQLLRVKGLGPRSVDIIQARLQDMGLIE